ncbi:hypothetical protein KY285_019420 [Solanum tuberosum]|nr:hypothetical protein KY285_019420 [Solanum tuberosum]
MRTAPQTPWVVFIFRRKSPSPPSSSSRLLRNPEPPVHRLSSKPQVPLLPLLSLFSSEDGSKRGPSDLLISFAPARTAPSHQRDPSPLLCFGKSSLQSLANWTNNIINRSAALTSKP